MTVVFDPAPDSFSVSKYNVSLVDAYTNVTLMSKFLYKNQPNHLRFANTEDGVYYILVSVTIIYSKFLNFSECGVKTEAFVFVGSFTLKPTITTKALVFTSL